LKQNRIASKLISMPLAVELSVPAKALITMMILTMGIAIAGAGGQIIVHDIIPNFFSTSSSDAIDMDHSRHTPSTRSIEAPPAEPGPMEAGDLFAGQTVEEKMPDSPFYKEEQFVWLLKWTHIHLFGINMIFVFMGGITLLLDLSTRFQIWLVILPFFGVAADIGTMWLKVYISEAFFWLHIPSGGLFIGIFFFTATRGLWEMWLSKNRSATL
jgi:hypothetical protein